MRNQRGQTARGQRILIEALESRTLLAANPVITEFMASNAGGLLDGNSNRSDWIEIQNQGDQPINLLGWHLTDNSNDLDKWTFPSKTLNPGQFLVVFASGNDALDPAGNLHTNFLLDAGGEYLALTRPDNSVASQFGSPGTDYPNQLEDVSYGTGTILSKTPVLNSAVPAKVHVPSSGVLGTSWVGPIFNDSGWTSGTTGVGYDTGGFEDVAGPAVLKARWSADSLGLANGQVVNTWTDSVGGATATRAGDPTYQANVINGHAVVRFDPSNGNDQLRVLAADNPMANAEDFTIAVVFRTSTGGVSGVAQWYNNTGIIDAEVGGVTNDWGMALTSGGRVAAGLGGPDVTAYTGTGNANGNAHVALYTVDDGAMRLFLDGGDGVAAAGSPAARVSSDMVFGSLQTNINYFTGDIAEIVIFQGEMDVTQAHATMNELGTKYAITIAPPTTPPGPTLIANWTADDLNGLANNATVTTWNSSIGTRPATNSGAPKLVKNQVNGHSVVRFDPMDGNDQLRVSAANSPMSDIGDFTMALVFKTAFGGAGGATQWYNNSGIVDAEVGGITNDWGLALTGGGQLGGGMGNPDTTLYTGGGLANGNAHVAVFSRQGGNIRLTIDGSSVVTGTSSAAARSSIAMVFGSLQTNLNYFRGDIAEVRVYDGAMTANATSDLSATLATKYAITLLPGPYDSIIGTDVQGAMHTQRTGAYVRVPFAVSNPAQYDRLFLNMRYDDGFVAYLNGTEVARRNAPGSVSWNSTSVLPRADDLALIAEEIDISAFAHLLQANNVLAIHGLNSSANDPDFLVLPEVVAATSLSGPAYFSAPTPGAANSEGFADYVRDVNFSIDRGIYSTAQNVQITTSTPGASIVYTTDGSAPTLSNGIIVHAADANTPPAANVNVTETTTLRATGFRNTFLSTNVDTQTYIFIADILTQPNVQPPGAYWDTEMDPNVVNAAQTHSVASALAAIPTMSLVLPDADIFGPSGIYPNPTQRGRAWEREASVEYFDPNDPLRTFQIDAGLRIQGGVVRDPSRPKKSFRLFFREEYGKGKLEFPIFGEDYVSRFDHLVLRGGHNYAWANAGGTPVERSDYLRDQMSRDLHRALTGTSSAGDFVHLYINGLYWGMYNIAEQIDEDFAANHLGGDDSEYDVLQPDNNGGLEVLAGTLDAWTTMFTTADAAMANGSIDDAEYASIRQYLDVTNLADYMINIIYRGDADAPTLIGNGISPRNFYAARRRVAGAGYQFFTWDGELSLDNLTIDRTETAGNQNPARLYQQLRTNAEFRQLVADRVYKHFFHEGPMRVSDGVNAPRDLFQTLVDKIDKAIVAESARWGDAKREPAGMRDTDWLGEINWLKNTFFPQRSATAFNQLRTDFTVLNTLPAEMRVNSVAQHGGQVTPGAALTLVDTAATGGIIYYTLDGTDPRLSGGGISASALTYTSALPLNQNRTVLTRIRVGATWSPLNQAAFTIHTPAAAANVAIGEINYNPVAPTAAELAINPAWTADDFEYVELINTSGVTVDLLNSEFEAGISHTFANLALALGQRGVLVKNPSAFAARYGSAITILGTFGGNLSNNGETIKLAAANDDVISDFAYSDSGSWPGRADGDGSSLEFVGGDPKLSGNWRSSYEYNGTPGSAGIGAQNAVVVNEILSNSESPATDAIELYNTTAGDINIGGWFLSDSKQYKKFRIPDNTIIPADQYLVFDESHFNPTPLTPGPNDFALDSAHGDDVWLTRALPDGTLIAFEDSVHFDAAPLGQTIGRVPNGSGRMYPLATNTIGGANSAAAIGPVIITELVYAPSSLNDDLEYVEIQNISDASLDVSGWMLDRGVQFAFAPGTILDAHEPVLLVHFDPADTLKLGALRAAYNIDPAVRIFGPYTGSLDDLGEDMRLARPDTPPANDPAFTPFVLVDEIDYKPAAPWPAVAAGQSLARKSNDVFAHDPTNWAAAVPDGGIVKFGHAYFQGAVQWNYTDGAILDSLTIEDTARVNLPIGRKTLRAASLSIAPSARLNLNDGFLIIDATPATRDAVLNAVNTHVRQGRIISTAAVAGATAVGVSRSDGAGSFGGQNIDANSILARWTVIGDANLDATVNHLDFNRLHAGFGQPTVTWGSGDFNYSGTTDFTDFQKLEQMFGQSLPAPAVIAPAKTTVKKPIVVAPPPMKKPVFATRRINRELLK